MRKSEKRARGGARQAIYRQESIDSGLRAQKKVTKAMQCVSEASKKTSKVLANHGG